MTARAAGASSRPIDTVFRALADPTRRRVLSDWAGHPASVSELAEPFDMALPSFLQHLTILERSGLVRSKKRGRVRTYAIPQADAPRRGLARPQRTVWEHRLDRLDQYLIELKENTT